MVISLWNVCREFRINTNENNRAVINQKFIYSPAASDQNGTISFVF